MVCPPSFQVEKLLGDMVSTQPSLQTDLPSFNRLWGESRFGQSGLPVPSISQATRKGLGK